MKRRNAARLGAFRRPGRLAGGIGVLCGAARIIGEFPRDPDPRLEDLGGGLIVRSLRAHKPTPDSALHELGSRS